MDSIFVIFDSAFLAAAVSPTAAHHVTPSSDVPGAQLAPKLPHAPYWLDHNGTRIHSTPRGHHGSYSKPAAAAAAASPSFIILDDVEYCPYQVTPYQGPTSALDCPADISLLWPPAVQEGQATVVEVSERA
jgi:hypothetical protein